MIEPSIVIVQRENMIVISYHQKRNHTKNEALLMPESHGELGTVRSLRLTQK
jgi:hypothetical protein